MFHSIRTAPRATLRAAFLSILASVGLQAAAAAQLEFSAPGPGETTSISFTGPGYDDLIVPTVNPPDFYRIEAKGGNGGTAKCGKGTTCWASGGRGALLSATFAVGSGTGQIPPGSRLRVIVGEAGGDIDKKKKGVQTYAGGGGGTGVIFQAPGSETWQPLIIAGGGSGGAQGVTIADKCGKTRPGKDGLFVECGGKGTGGTNQSGGAGGCDGNAGANGGSDDQYGGGGGGWLTGASSTTSGAAGFPVGGTGGAPDSMDEDSAGGWGCGGGGGAAGASGGGGGYSGGGGGGHDGEFEVHGGGGGGSFVWAFGSRLEQGYATGGSNNGWVQIDGIAASNGDTCSSAFVIPDQPVTEFSLFLNGDTTGKNASFPVDCAGGPAKPEQWYIYTNTTDCDRLVYLTETLSPGAVWARIYYGACGDSSSPFCESMGGIFPYVVPSGGSMRIQVGYLSSVPTVEGQYSTFFRAVSLGPDIDFDAIPDCIDNCLQNNPSQLDSDGDGVGDTCDQCPGGDDRVDSDQDAVPDACDQCPGAPDFFDFDFDGVPDDCDVCAGDDTIDTDGDGIPDDCDLCPGISGDCNQNGVDDNCDLAVLSRFEVFDGMKTPLYRMLGSAELNDAAGQLVLSDTNVQGTINFEPVSPMPVSKFRSEVWFQIDQTFGPGGGDGLALSFFDDAVHGSTSTFGANGLGASSIDILFDTKADPGDINGNHMELRYNGQSLKVEVPTFFIENGTWRKAIVELENSAITVSIELDGVVIDKPFDKITLPGFAPFVTRYGAGASTGSESSWILVDQWHFQDLSGTVTPDLDANGTLDACQGSVPAVRTSPANPTVLVLGAGPGLTLGSTYKPFINHASFMPNGFTDFLLVALAPANLPLPPYGDLLVGQPQIASLQVAPGAPFAVSIPMNPALLGTPLSMQGAGFDLTALPGQEVQLTNAIDGLIGGWQPFLPLGAN